MKNIDVWKGDHHILASFKNKVIVQQQSDVFSCFLSPDPKSKDFASNPIDFGSNPIDFRSNPIDFGSNPRES